jgi:methanogenic corrinoid protein MtbC1
LLKGDRTQCREIVENLLEAATEVRELYMGLFQRSMYEVGELWEQHRISVASATHTNRSAVIACVANEYHQIGGKMVADLFELNGWHGYFLGANMPQEDLVRLIENKKPELVGLSLAVYSNLPSLLKVMDAVTSAFPQLRILVGGQAFRWGGREAVSAYRNAVYVSSLPELEALLREASGSH